MFPNKRQQTDSSEESSSKKRRIDVGADESHVIKGDVDDELKLLRERIAALEQQVRVKSDALERAHACIQCYICQDMMRNPYNLECGHAACLKCLKSWFTKPHAATEATSPPRRFNERTPIIETISTDEESDGDETVMPPALQPTVQRPSGGTSLTVPSTPPSRSQRGRHFFSVINREKKCPCCTRVVRRRPFFDFTLQHVIDSIQLPPLSPAAVQERDARWRRRGDVWRGIFPADLDDSHQVQTPRPIAPLPQRRRPTSTTILPAVPSSSTPPPPSTRRTLRDDHRVQRRSQPYSISGPRVRRVWEAGRHDDVSSVPRTQSPSPPPPPRAAILSFYDRMQQQLQRAVSPTPYSPAEQSEFVLGSPLELPAQDVEPFLFPPAPRLSFIDSEDEDLYEETGDVLLPQLTGLSAPGPQARTPPPPPPAHTPISNPSTETQPPQLPIVDILNILRPQRTPSNAPEDKKCEEGDDKDPAQTQTGDNKRSCSVSESTIEVDNSDSAETDDENMELIHAMLHGEGRNANTVVNSSSSPSRAEHVERYYPVYIEELEDLMYGADPDGDDV